MFTTSPSYSESISFISFIASMMQSTSPFLTVDPTSTNGAAFGSADRKNVPTIGALTTASSRSFSAEEVIVSTGIGAVGAGEAEDGMTEGTADATAGAATTMLDA